MYFAAALLLVGCAFAFRHRLLALIPSSTLAHFAPLHDRRSVLGAELRRRSFPPSGLGRDAERILLRRSLDETLSKAGQITRPKWPRDMNLRILPLPFAFPHIEPFAVSEAASLEYLYEDRVLYTEQLWGWGHGDPLHLVDPTAMLFLGDAPDNPTFDIRLVTTRAGSPPFMLASKPFPLKIEWVDSIDEAITPVRDAGLDMQLRQHTRIRLVRSNREMRLIVIMDPDVTIGASIATGAELAVLSDGREVAREDICLRSQGILRDTTIPQRLRVIGDMPEPGSTIAIKIAGSGRVSLSEFSCNSYWAGQFEVPPDRITVVER